MNHYAVGDHASVAEFVQDALGDVPWVMTYDDVPEIRQLYRRLRARFRSFWTTVRVNVVRDAKCSS